MGVVEKGIFKVNGAVLQERNTIGSLGEARLNNAEDKRSMLLVFKRP